MDKSEALRLADELERDKWRVPAVVMQAAADELRRLHAENAVLHDRHHDGNVILTQMLAQRDRLVESLKEIHGLMYTVSVIAKQAVEKISDEQV